MIHAESHGTIVSRLSVSRAVTGLGVAAWRVDSVVAVFSLRGKYRPRCDFKQLGILGRTQRSFMQAQHFHVNTGNYICLCTSCYPRPPLLLPAYFMQFHKKRQTACPARSQKWFSSTQTPNSAIRGWKETSIVWVYKHNSAFKVTWW